MRTIRIIFWVTTTFICLFQGVAPALSFRDETAREVFRHLGYPEYFRIALTMFKISGAVLLAIPQITRRIKEWVYAGFTFDFIFAALSFWAVDGFGVESITPLIFLLVLGASYITHYKLQEQRSAPIY